MNDTQVKRLLLHAKMQESAAKQQAQQVGFLINMTQGMLNAVAPPEVVADVCFNILANMAVTSGIPLEELNKTLATAYADYAEKNRKMKLAVTHGELRPELKVQ